MHICFKIVKFLLQSMSLYMFRTLLCPSSGAFHHGTCSLWLPCDFVLVASSSPVLLIQQYQQSTVDTAVSTEQGWRTQPTQHHMVTRGCMCSGGRLLMMDTAVSETCRAT
jgi:hypothetical protein